MSAAIAQRGPHAEIADAVDAHLRGEHAAKVVLHDVELGVALPDALGHMLHAVSTAWGRHGLIGASRAIQKRLERALV